MYCKHCEREIITNAQTCLVCDRPFRQPNKNSQNNDHHINYEHINKSEIKNEVKVYTVKKKSKKDVLEDYEKKYMKKEYNFLPDNESKKIKSKETEFEKYEKNYLKKIGRDKDVKIEKLKETEFEEYEKNYLKRLGIEND